MSTIQRFPCQQSPTSNQSHSQDQDQRRSMIPSQQHRSSNSDPPNLQKPLPPLITSNLQPVTHARSASAVESSRTCAFSAVSSGPTLVSSSRLSPNDADRFRSNSAHSDPPHSPHSPPRRELHRSNSISGRSAPPEYHPTSATLEYVPDQPSPSEFAAALEHAWRDA
ncbi:hypothetical protein MMC09_004063 [Bachmanniomyces sp. S44760]|nr:hypothetical protein [Bachmanniomyces sp. S44760]